MQTYEIEVREKLSRVIKIEAKNSEEAVQLVKDLYEAETVILDANDLLEPVEFEDINK